MIERERPLVNEPEVPSLELQFGERIVTLTAEDTIIRRFTQGGGTFDHCVHFTEGRLVAFTPTEEAMEKLVSLGFPVRHDEEIDEATIEHFSRVQAAAIDEERDWLGL